MYWLISFFCDNEPIAQNLTLKAGRHVSHHAKNSPIAP